MREKLEHIWYYYKWYIIAGIWLLILALNFLGQKSGQTKYAHEVALVTGREISAEQLDRLSARLSADGSVRVNYYRYDADAMAAEDTDLFSAAAVQLAGDLYNRISCCYITDRPELLAEARPELIPLGLAGDCAALAECEEIKEFMLFVFNKEDIAWIN